jgi:uncharacterized repeat protein (TIGR02543 family)
MAFLSLNARSPNAKETSMSIQWIKALRTSKTRRRKFATFALGTTGIAIVVILALFIGDGAKAQTVVATPSNCTVDGGVAASSVSNVCDGSQSTKTVFTADAIVLKVTLSKPAIVTGVNITPGDDDNLYPYRVASATQIQGCTSAGQGCETAGTNAFSYYEVSIVGAGLNQTFDSSKYGCEILGTGTRCMQFSEITFNTSVTTRTLSFGSVVRQTYNTTQTVTATASAGTGTITYSSSDTGKCTVDSSTGVVTATSGTGTCSITASVASDGVYSAATATVDITLAKAAQATFNFTRSTFMMVWDGVAYSKDITFTPSGGSGTGSISYSVSNNTATNCSLVPNGSAWTISADTGGQCRITAVKAGDSNYLAATFSTSTYTGNSTYADFLFQRATLANPTGLSATPIAQSSSLTVSFTKAANATDTQVALYVDGTTTSTFKTATIAGTSYTFTGLTANTTYYFAAKSIAATNDAYYFTASNFSSRVSATTNTPAALVVTTPTSGLSATKGTLYSLDLSGLASGGYGLKTFTVTGSLPGGLTLSGSTISGTPTNEGSFSITSTVKDEDLASATTASFAIVVAPVAPTITTQPTSTTTVAEGGSATLSVTATGTSLSYQWKKDGTAISGATSSALILNPLGANDGGTYTVDITSTVNSVTSAVTTSSNAALVVVDAPAIATQPLNKKSYLSVPNSFSVSASVAAGGLISYVWEVSTNGGTTWTAISGATSSSYSMTPTLLTEDGKQFRVKVTNTRNSVTKTTTSSAAILNVYSTFSWTTQTSTSISPGPSVGKSYTYNVASNHNSGGIPNLTYGIASGSLPTGLSLNSATGQISGTPAAGTVGSYNFNVSVTDGNGGLQLPVGSKPFSLSVAKSVFDTPTGFTATATPGKLKSIDFTWSALTQPEWLADANRGYKITYGTSGSLTVSASATSATITDATFANGTSYNFYIVATGSPTNPDYAASLNAMATASTLTPTASPTISTGLGSTTFAFTSSSITLQVTATSPNGGTLSYQWFKGGTAVSGATNSSLTVTSRAGSGGTDSYSVNVTNTLNGVPSVAVTSSTTLQSVSFTIDSYGTNALSNWVVNSPITHTRNASIFGSVYGDTLSFALTSGTLPAGVSFSTTSGTFSGTPTEAVSNRSMTVTSTSSISGLSTTNTFNINIAKLAQATLSLSLSSSSSQTGPSKTINVTVGGGSGTGDYTIGVASGTSSSCKINGGTTPVIATAGSNSVTLSSSTLGNQGTCSVTLNRAADSIYKAATQTSASFLFLNATDTPGSFTAAATTNTKKSIKLTWTNGGSSASSTLTYRVGIYDSAGGFISNVSSIAGTLVSGTTYTATITATQFPAIADGTTYKFNITSIGNGWSYGESIPTSLVSATTYLVADTPTVADVSTLSNSITVGGTQSFSATASVTDGGTLTYQWQVATSADSYATWSDVTGGTGATSTSYTTAALTNASVGYKFRLRVTNTFTGPDTTATATAYSSQFALTVTKTSQTITFSNPGDKVLGSGTFTVAPTTTATGVSVAVTSSTASICTVSGSTVTLVTAGTCSLNANQSGNSSYDAATQVSQSFAVTPPAPVIGTQPANYTGFNSTSSAGFSVVATVSTGNLSYQWQSSTDSGVTWSNVGTSSTSYSQSVSPSGSFTFDGYRYRVIVTNTVNSITASTTSNEATLSIRLVQTIGTSNFPTTRTAYLDQGTISYSAVTGGGSGNPVTFTVTTPSVCSISGTTLTLLTVGSCVVKANQAGLAGATPFYPALEATQTVTISAARSAQTITFAQPSSATFGDSAITLAPSSDSGLVVTLSSSTTSVCTVSSFAVTIVAAGTCTINADQAGDTSFVPATRVTRSFTVQKKAVTVTAALSASSISANGTLPTRSFSATGLVSPNTITGVTYTWKNSSNLTVASMNTATSGTFTLVPSAAVFGSGAANYDVTYQSASLVIKAPQTITFTQPSSATYGDTPVTLSPSTNASGLSVTLSSTSTTVCSVSGLVVTFLAAGNCVLNAEQAGNSAYDAATQVQRTLVVAKKNLTITSTLSSSNISVGGSVATASFSAPALVGSDAITVTQTYTDAGTYNSTTQPTAVGSYTLTPSAAVFTSGSADNYNISYVAASLTITAQTQSISFTTIATQTFGVSPITAVATATSGLTVSFTSSTTTVCTVSGSTITILAVGTCTIAADQPGSSSYSPATTVTKSFTVSPKPLTQGAVTATSPAGERMTISATWTAVTNATGYVVKLWSSGTTEWKSFTVDANTTSQSFSPTNTTNLVDNAPYTVSVMATGTGNYTNSAVVHSSLTYTRSVAVVNYNPQQGAGYSPSEFSGTLPSQQRYINGAASPLTVSLNTGNYARVGYDFMGWNTQPNGSGTTYTPGVTTTYGDINLWPMWERTALTVTFNSNYGTPTTSTQTFEYGVLKNLDANTFTRTGYTFAGWATTSGGSVSQTDGSGIIVTVNRTLYAKWTAIDYTVTYAANGSSATVPTETAKNVGDTVTVKTGITRTGYQFLGWSDGSTTYSPAATLTMPARNLTLTAMWQIDVYAITYNSNAADSGSPSRTSENFTYGSPAISLPTVGTLAKAGYTFGGWSSSQNGTVLTGNYTPTTDVTLWAVWSPNTYTVTYNTNGATGAPSRTTDSYTTNNAAIAVPTVGTMTKPGHTFAGWATSANGSSVGNTLTTTTDVTMYALWQTISYTVIYDPAGGASTPTETNKTIGQTFTLASGPTRANYSFAGWNDGSSTYAAGTTYRVDSANVTLTARWVRIYWVHYNFNGANEVEPADVEKLDQSSHVAALAPTKNGYTFGGWTAQNGDPIAAGATFTVDSNHYILSATWNAISYSVSYSSAGSNLPSESNKTIGQTFSVGSAPSRAGYVFTGWNDGLLSYGPGATYVVGNQNITLTAVWKAIQYRVTYDLNSGTSATPVQANRTIGQTFEVAAAPARYGYTFVKWSDGTADYLPGSSYTTGADDVTLTAVWTPTQRSVSYDLNGASGTAPSETAKVIGDTFSLAAAPSFAGKVFVGWNDGTLTYAAGANYTVGGSSVNLTAQWVAALLTPSFASGGAQGSSPTVSAVAVGMRFTLPGAGTLSKPGFTFGGWSDGTSIAQAGSSYSMPASGATFTAVWTPVPTSSSSGGGAATPVPSQALERVIKFGDPAVLLEAQNALGAPITWKSRTATCSVNQLGQVTAKSVGRCEVIAVRNTDFSIASSHILVIEPRLSIELRNAVALTSKSAVINASVLWPGSNFKAKLCVTKSAQATDCLIASTVTIENEDSISNSSEAPFVISRNLQGLEPATTYFLHAAVMVGDTSYKTVAQMLRTPSISTPKSRALTKSTSWVSWSDMAAGSNAKLVLSGKTICEKAVKNCKVKDLIGPKSNLQIIATNKAGVEALPVVPTFQKLTKPILLVSVQKSSSGLTKKQTGLIAVSKAKALKAGLKVKVAISRSGLVKVFAHQ